MTTFVDNMGAIPLIIVLVAVCCVAFWLQAVVTEERLIPALNSIADKCGLTDDVAGATLIAAGASSAVLVSSLLALFVAHSSLGVGTIVGSAIFNQLIIIGACAMSAKSTSLKLDQTLVLREASFNFLAIVLLLIAMADRQPKDSEGQGDNDGSGAVEYIHITRIRSLILLAAYVVYVIVLRFFDSFTGRKENERGFTGVDPPEVTNGVVESNANVQLKPNAKIPFVRYVSKEPAANFQINETKMPPLHELMIEELYTHRSWDSGDSDSSIFPTLCKQAEYGNDGVSGSGMGQCVPSPEWYHNMAVCGCLPDQSSDCGVSDMHPSTVADNDLKDSIKTTKVESVRSVKIVEQSEKSAATADSGTSPLLARKRRQRTLNLCAFVIHDTIPQPSKMFHLTDLVRNDTDQSFSCFLWVQSNFYNKSRVAFNAWQLRWFTFCSDRFYSVPDRAYQKHEFKYKRPHKIEIDDNHLLFKIYTHGGRQKSYVFMAPSLAILREAVHVCRNYTDEWGVSEDVVSSAAGIWSDGDPSEYLLDERSASLVAYPSGATLWLQLIFILLLPFRWAIHLTVPDQRVVPLSREGDVFERSTWVTSYIVVSGTAWIVLSSFFLVESLEIFGTILNIPDTVIGITVAAAGKRLRGVICGCFAQLFHVDSKH